MNGGSRIEVGPRTGSSLPPFAERSESTQQALAAFGLPTTAPGSVNRNRQLVVRRTELPGNDHQQRVYELRCLECDHHYGANGSDIFQRRCPNCGGGAPGLPFE